MIYQQSLEIERRLGELLELIRVGEHSTPSLAEALGVSIPTVSRCIAALRDRGHDIRSVRGAHGWHYVYAPQPTAASPNCLASRAATHSTAIPVTTPE